jgi:hypothetical protein
MMTERVQEDFPTALLFASPCSFCVDTPLHLVKDDKSFKA